MKYREAEISQSLNQTKRKIITNREKIDGNRERGSEDGGNFLMGKYWKETEVTRTRKKHLML